MEIATLHIRKGEKTERPGPAVHAKLMAFVPTVILYVYVGTDTLRFEFDHESVVLE